MKLKTGKRFRKARNEAYRNPPRLQRFVRKLHRQLADYWAIEAACHEPSSGRLLAASKAGRGRWRR